MARRPWRIGLALSLVGHLTLTSTIAFGLPGFTLLLDRGRVGSGFANVLLFSEDKDVSAPTSFNAVGLEAITGDTEGNDEEQRETRFGRALTQLGEPQPGRSNVEGRTLAPNSAETVESEEIDPSPRAQPEFREIVMFVSVAEPFDRIETGQSSAASGLPEGASEGDARNTGGGTNDATATDAAGRPLPDSLAAAVPADQIATPPEGEAQDSALPTLPVATASTVLPSPDNQPLAESPGRSAVGADESGTASQAVTAGPLQAPATEQSAALSQDSNDPATRSPEPHTDLTASVFQPGFLPLAPTTGNTSRERDAGQPLTQVPAVAGVAEQPVESALDRAQIPDPQTGTSVARLLPRADRDLSGSIITAQSADIATSPATEGGGSNTLAPDALSTGPATPAPAGDVLARLLAPPVQLTSADADPNQTQAGWQPPDVRLARIGLQLAEIAEDQEQRLRTLAERSAVADREAAAQSIQRLRRLADQGFAHAQYALAERYLLGGDVEQDIDEARRLLRDASRQDFAPAQELLATLSASGVGKPRDLGEAVALLDQAAANGSDTARQLRQELEPFLSPEDILRAAVIRQEFKPDLSNQRRPRYIGNEGTSLTADLNTAAIAGDIGSIATALSQGADPDGKDTSGRTAMINAAWRGRVEAINALLDAGASLTVADPDGRTPLMWASSNGHATVVDALVDANVPVDQADAEGVTALMRAAWNGNPDIVRELVRAGANPTRRDAEGNSVLDYARRNGNQQVLAVLTGTGG
ncbi:MAG: ankyrin repeat domain-containing protein [Alphaproteobacteria bacterium]